MFCPEDEGPERDDADDRPQYVDAARVPVACGAVGAYDSTRVRAMAESLGTQLVHESRTAALACDPRPLTWRRGVTRGWAWGGQPLRPQAATRSWRDAACDLGSAGLVITPGRRPFVHSSVSGTTPLYWIEEAEAIYFSSRIDTLVRTTMRTLTVDWEAWSAIFTIGQPIGDRTPFAEVRRLRPYSRLEPDPSAGATVHEEPWPWAAVDCGSPASTTVAAAADAMRSVVDRLDPGEVSCPLSGGRDSRLLLALLRDRDDLDPRAYTVAGPGGDEREREVAGMVAGTLGVPLERVSASFGPGWKRVEERSLLCGYEFVRAPWLSPVVPPLARRGAPVTDGLGLDQFLPVWRVGDPAFISGAETTRHLWRLYRGRRLKGVLLSDMESAMVASARRQLFDEAERFRDHPQAIFLAAFWLRTVRGVSTVPTMILGDRLEMVTPFVDHDVVRALMAIPPAEKVPGRASPALVHAIDPRLAHIPTARDFPPAHSSRSADPALPDAELRANLSVVDAGALGEWLDPEYRTSLAEEPRAAAGARRSSRMLALIMFSLWQRRYAALLAPVDAGELVAS